MRPVDLLRLLLVLAEVPGRVEELLRDDRRAQVRVLERHPLVGLVGAAVLEQLAHVGDVEDDDLVAVDEADPVVRPEADELHAATSPQPGDDLRGVPVGRKHRVEDLRDVGRLEDERDAACTARRRRRRTSAGRARRRAAAPGPRSPGTACARGPRAPPAPSSDWAESPATRAPSSRELGRVVAKGTGLRRAAACARESHPSRPVSGGPGVPVRGYT